MFHIRVSKNGGTPKMLCKGFPPIQDFSLGVLPGTPRLGHHLFFWQTVNIDIGNSAGLQANDAGPVSWRRLIQCVDAIMPSDAVVVSSYQNGEAL